jgi:hypothetical protein
VELTQQRLLAQLLGLFRVLEALELGQRLVHERQHVNAGRVNLRLELNGLVELLNCLVKLLLVQEQLAVVDVRVGQVLKVLDAPLQRCKAGRDRAELVLHDAELDVGEDEVVVQVDGLLVVLGSSLEFANHELELAAVVVDVRIVRRPFDGLLEVFERSVAIVWDVRRLSR